MYLFLSFGTLAYASASNRSYPVYFMHRLDAFILFLNSIPLIQTQLTNSGANFVFLLLGVCGGLQFSRRVVISTLDVLSHHIVLNTLILKHEGAISNVPCSYFWNIMLCTSSQASPTALLVEVKGSKRHD